MIDNFFIFHHQERGLEIALFSQLRWRRRAGLPHCRLSVSHSSLYHEGLLTMEHTVRKGGDRAILMNREKMQNKPSLTALL